MSFEREGEGQLWPVLETYKFTVTATDDEIGLVVSVPTQHLLAAIEELQENDDALPEEVHFLNKVTTVERANEIIQGLENFKKQYLAG